ncbi:4-hydroxyphenylacetate 3-monooxygenase reductase subunit [Nocardia nova]|uniref:4-hydroxyphenylacetate 3-monooxygenase reductase subunit n=1 Tax=Nocardia nova TaxID=37330 RepID=A0A2S6AKK9_9NOCA|nr:flavin reductase [Nocardia nova]PPJ22292.1 4-hydroxyphenylacetate 3-monooxygenase reductase subunit [Nocardia nova]PPJ35754.1 4-hydroxyphenylacetate 3-monooxygenase reductase subunit [Nocardia nova]
MSELTRTQREYRSAMANLSAAVSVVTTDGSHGRAGMTVSAACSVTDEPPTMLVCVNKSSRSHDILLANGRLCVNVLGAHQQELAMHFAGATNVPTDERFEHGVWDHETDDVPVLRDALASIVGRIVAGKTLGSHSVLFVEVDKVTTRQDSEALIYFQRRFHSVAVSSLSA